MADTRALDRLISDETDSVATRDTLYKAFASDPNVTVNFKTSIPGVGDGEAFFKEFGERTPEGLPVYRLFIRTGYGHWFVGQTAEESVEQLRKIVQSRLSGEMFGQSPNMHETMYGAQLEDLIYAIVNADPKYDRGVLVSDPNQFPLSVSYSIPGMDEPAMRDEIHLAKHFSVEIGYGLESLTISGPMMDLTV